jgi:hypothetical protein
MHTERSYAESLVEHLDVSGDPANALGADAKKTSVTYVDLSGKECFGEIL